MDGIVPRPPWQTSTKCLRAPVLGYPFYQRHGGLFDDFPERSGISISAPENAAHLARRCKTTGSLAALMQSWLFFELLSVFLSRDINRDDLVTEGFVDIDKEIVHEYFRDWRRTVSRLSFSRKQQALDGLQGLIRSASARADAFEEAADLLATDADDDFDLVALSVRLLINLLHAIVEDALTDHLRASSGVWLPFVARLTSWIFRRETMQYICGGDNFGSIRENPIFEGHIALMNQDEARRHVEEQQGMFRLFPPGDYHGGCAARRLYRVFISNNWCPYRALLLCRSHDYLILNNLASLKRSPDLTKREDHTRCVEAQRCCAHNLVVDRPSEYPFRHAVDGLHECGFVGIPLEEVVRIIQSDGIPIVSVNAEGDDLDLQVVRFTPELTYTAISHVWSDGMGNPQSNAMLQCQLLRLREAVFQTYFPEYSPFYDDSTSSSRDQSTLYWRISKAIHATRPYTSGRNRNKMKRIHFWIDTLCIPILAESRSVHESKTLRCRAMRHITPIFAGAYNTLIFDEDFSAMGVRPTQRFSGDEFSAIVLSSKWMQRGWTLEEGCLSANCVFQMAGKPYEMWAALVHLLPKAEAQHSPLERASINARRSLTLLLRRAVLVEKKQLAAVSSASSLRRLTGLLRIPQFVWTWNSLLDRSTTRKHDGTLILTNLLDFNVSSLMRAPTEERLKLLIQNCDELPLSLLYNTGPRMEIHSGIPHPELGWIPRSIEGDHLSTGAALRRHNPRVESPGQVEFFIDRSSCDPGSVLFLALYGQLIPHDVDVFVVRAPAWQRGNTNIEQEYIIEIQRGPVKGPGDAASRRLAHQIYPQSSYGMCFVIDRTCGTGSCRGFLGKGVRFYIEGSPGRKFKAAFLKYDSPLIAWTREQWEFKYSFLRAAIPHFRVEHVRPSQRLLLQYDSSLWGEKMIRRPLLHHQPGYAKAVGSIAFVLAAILVLIACLYPLRRILDALHVDQKWLKGDGIISAFAPFLTLFIYDPIRRRLAMYKYRSWLKSFEDERNAQARGWKNSILRFPTVYTIRRIALGWGWIRGVYYDAAGQGPICLLPVHGNETDAEDLPGEIFLQ